MRVAVLFISIVIASGNVHASEAAGACDQLYDLLRGKVQWRDVTYSYTMSSRNGRQISAIETRAKSWEAVRDDALYERAQEAGLTFPSCMLALVVVHERTFTRRDPQSGTTEEVLRPITAAGRVIISLGNVDPVSVTVERESAATEDMPPFTSWKLSFKLPSPESIRCIGSGCSLIASPTGMRLFFSSREEARKAADLITQIVSVCPK